MADHAEAHGALAHREHRQGDVELADGSRLFTCTKNVIDGSRTSMLLVRGLFRLDVEGRDQDFRIAVRNLTQQPMQGGPEAMTHRVTTTFEGYEQHISEFEMRPTGGPVGSVRVTIARPADRDGERFTCTAMAIVQRAAA